MRRVFLGLIALALPFLPACERQRWEETKMFHEVPGKHHGPAVVAPAATKAAPEAK